MNNEANLNEVTPADEYSRTHGADLNDLFEGIAARPYLPDFDRVGTSTPASMKIGHVVASQVKPRWLRRSKPDRGSDA